MSRLLTRRPNPRCLGLVAVALGWLCLAPGARAENIQVTVLAIVATDRDTKIDHEVKCIAELVRKKHPSLTGFSLVRTTCKSIPVGGQDTFPLLPGQDATICITSGVGKDNKASLTVKGPGRDEMMCSVICGKCLPLKTTHVTKDGGLLFLAILIRPCNKGK
jgi:hypothetical protein